MKDEKSPGTCFYWKMGSLFSVRKKNMVCSADRVGGWQMLPLRFSRIKLLQGPIKADLICE